MLDPGMMIILVAACFGLEYLTASNCSFANSLWSCCNQRCLVVICTESRCLWLQCFHSGCSMFDYWLVFADADLQEFELCFTRSMLVADPSCCEYLGSYYLASMAAPATSLVFASFQSLMLTGCLGSSCCSLIDGHQGSCSAGSNTSHSCCSSSEPWAQTFNLEFCLSGISQSLCFGWLASCSSSYLTLTVCLRFFEPTDLTVFLACFGCSRLQQGTLTTICLSVMIEAPSDCFVFREELCWTRAIESYLWCAWSSRAAWSG